MSLVTRVVLGKVLNISKPEWGFPGGSAERESTCDAGDTGLIPESGRSLGREMATLSSALAGKIPWTEEPGGLQSMGLQRVGYD